MICIATAAEMLVPYGGGPISPEWRDVIVRVDVSMLVPAGIEALSIGVLRKLFARALATERTGVALIYIFAGILSSLSMGTIFAGIAMGALFAVFDGGLHGGLIFGRIALSQFIFVMPYLIWAVSIASILAATIVLALVGRFTYAFLPRVAYAVLKHQILKNGKGAAAIAIALIRVSRPEVGAILEKVMKGIVG